MLMGNALKRPPVNDYYEANGLINGLLYPSVNQEDLWQEFGLLLVILQIISMR